MREGSQKERSQDSNMANHGMQEAVRQATNLRDELRTTTSSTHWFNQQAAMPRISAAWATDASQGRVPILETSAMWGAIRAASAELTNIAIDREF